MRQERGYNSVCSVGAVVWRVAERLENRAVASGESCVCVQVETVEGPNGVSSIGVAREFTALHGNKNSRYYFTSPRTRYRDLAIQK